MTEFVSAQSAASSYADTFNKDGFVSIRNALDSEHVDRLHHQAVNNFTEVLDKIETNKLSFGLKTKLGFKDIVQRHEGRFEMPYHMDTEIFNEVSHLSIIRETVASILGPDATIVNQSLVNCLPGAKDQSWHIDGPHMSTSSYLPCHCLNVFVPLIDIPSLEFSPTEFRPGSQTLTFNLTKMFLLAAARKRLNAPEHVLLDRGDILMFDYRVLHRGRANTSGIARPVLVFTFAKSWFKDVLNFPARSVDACIEALEMEKGSEGPEETVEVVAP